MKASEKLAKELDEEGYYRTLLEKAKKKQQLRRKVQRLMIKIFHHSGIHSCDYEKQVYIDGEEHEIYKCRACGKILIDKHMCLDSAFLLIPLLIILAISSALGLGTLPCILWIPVIYIMIDMVLCSIL